MQPEAEFNSWDYLDNVDLLQEVSPTILKRIDRKVGLHAGKSIGSHFKVVASFEGFNNDDEFSNNKTFLSSDTLDHLKINGYRTGLNFSMNDNRVVKIKEGLTEIVVATHFGYSGATATMKYVPGYPVGNIYGSTYLRYYGSKPDDKINVDKSLPLVIAATGVNRGWPVRDGTQRILCFWC